MRWAVRLGVALLLAGCATGEVTQTRQPRLERVQAAVQAAVAVEVRRLAAWHPDTAGALLAFLDGVCAAAGGATTLDELVTAMSNTVTALALPEPTQTHLREFIPVLAASVQVAVGIAGQTAPPVAAVQATVRAICQAGHGAT